MPLKALFVVDAFFIFEHFIHTCFYFDVWFALCFFSSLYIYIERQILLEMDKNQKKATTPLLNY